MRTYLHIEQTDPSFEKPEENLINMEHGEGTLTWVEVAQGIRVHGSWLSKSLY